MTIFERATIVLASLTLGFGLCLPAQAAEPTLFDDLGGKPGIEKIVADFLPILQADPRINTFFAKTDMKQLGVLLSEQFCQLAGGPCTYSGRDMVASHDGMGVKSAHFNALAEDLQIAMENNKVPSSVANRLVAKLAPMKHAIVR
ncbi:group 1 truncated hemoglobin [Massilia sp. CF038]|uniref:group I truncated hemoglobin n=1 Tax=Massilia sp. CF038 TaxID=1881045 RepID=UPI000912C6A1|nr:group 1 truncated hemoglobin [Massilia sp. CF038]SHG45672.1 hemoglobin [Massilia sp. CF038]